MQILVDDHPFRIKVLSLFVKPKMSNKSEKVLLSKILFKMLLVKLHTWKKVNFLPPMKNMLYYVKIHLVL